MVSADVTGSGAFKLICHFPFEWEKNTVDVRFSWLKTGSDVHDPMSEESYAKFKAHAEALCFDSGSLASGRLWHFEPKGFIRQLKKCVWIDDEIIEKVMAANTKPAATLQVGKIKEKVEEYYRAINTIMNKYNLYNAKRQCHFLGQGAVESGYLLLMQELSQEQFVKDGVNIGGGIVADSRRDENTDLGHWYGFLSTEVDEYFSGNKYNSKGG